MHAQRIIQDLLQTECGTIHAKRRVTLALMVQASCIGHLSLIGISRRLDTATALRHRIKRCDRLLGNLHLSREKLDVYRAMAQRILIGNPRPAIVIDWSDLSATAVSTCCAPRWSSKAAPLCCMKKFIP